MNLYRKKKRAVVYECGDLRFKTSRKEYPWYWEEEFPPDMKEIVEKDNPFGGWYRYEEEEVFIQIGRTID